MATDNLKQTLIELHAALEQAGPLDPELLHLLKVLDRDIQSKLLGQAEGLPPDVPRGAAHVAPHQDVTPQQPASVEDAGLNARAQALSARFAAQHPHLEPVLRELTDTLQRIGI